jgi:hypothetical protein
VWGGTSGRGEGEGRRLRWQHVVDGLHIPIWNRTKKPFAIALSGVRRWLRGRDDGDSVTKWQYNSNQNCHYDSTPVNEYILIKIIKKRKEKFLSHVLERFPWQKFGLIVITILGKRSHCLVSLCTREQQTNRFWWSQGIGG